MSDAGTPVRDCFDVMSTPIRYDDSIGYKIHKLTPTNNAQANLNNGETLDFKWSGSTNAAIRLIPGKCAFRVRAAFRTRAAAVADVAGETEAQKAARQLAADKVAKTTLSPNWFWHLFSNYKLKVANLDTTENLSELGVYADTMALFRGSEYKRTYGELSSYVPDEGSGEANDLEFNVTTDAIAAGGAVPANHVKIAYNTAYNHGFDRRMDRYNYTLADDETTGIRYIEEVFPLSDISGFFGVDKVLLNTQFEITLVRKHKDKYQEAVFGAANTSIDFGNTTDTGILNMSLELYEQKPTLAVASKLNADFGNSDKQPIPFSYLKANCRAYQMENAEVFPISESCFTVPRYVIVVFKGKKHANDNEVAIQDGSVTKNFSLNAHANIKNIQVTIDGDEYPNVLQDAMFNRNYYSQFYQQYIDTCTSLGQDPCLTSVEFKNLYPVFAFDCSDQAKKVSTKNTNLRIGITRNAVPAANDSRMDPRNLACYVIVLEDKFLQLDAKQGTAKTLSVLD